MDTRKNECSSCRYINGHTSWCPRRDSAVEINTPEARRLEEAAAAVAYYRHGLMSAVRELQDAADAVSPDGDDMTRVLDIMAVASPGAIDIMVQYLNNERAI